ncbi:amino acid adenylation domain-containing protein [Pedobacter cryoconitis]|uniref:Amino acid adenylation domain-containing protein n=1 Tax=Pedobacter cryoconitis TaxID=188932 RepID=A0A7W8ZJX9_9SPHI|nr:non-ribosomal peptide synthetase [Pedobacter cryoconitis]MBB5635252.1 amino acid adenylation domain-containing protein [Pedobacter cryoconitis]
MLSQNLTDIEGLLKRANAMGVEIFLEDDELIVETSEEVEIDEDFWDELRNNKTQLTAYLRDHSPQKKGQPIITNVVPVSQYAAHIPLSYSQESLWFIDRLEGSTHYHIPAILRLKGKVDHAALEMALQTIINRHEVLRTVIREEDGVAYQHVMKADRWKMDVFNDQGMSSVQTFIEQPFDLSAAHMLRAGLFQVTENEELLVIVMHHIASDGWSLSIIVKELSALYEAYTKGSIPELSVMAVQYADYAIWQKTYISGDLLQRQQAYWKKQLSGIEPLQLTTDFARPAVQSTRGAVLEKVFSKALHEQLNELSRKHDVTLFMTLLAAFQVLLYRHSGQDDICVGTPIAGRLRREVEELVGYFINTLAIRSDLSDNPSFTALLKQVKNTLLDSYDHQDIPFEKIVDVIVKERDMSRGPLFQVMFVLQNTPDSHLSLGDLRVTIEEPENTTAKFDLTFNLRQSEQGLSLSAEYCTDLFKEETVLKFIAHYEELLHAIIAKPDENIGALRMLRHHEEYQLLQEFSGLTVGYPQGTTILDLIDAQVKRVPDAIAVVYEDEKLTYRELDERSGQLGHYLRSQGVQAETLVPVCLERSLDMIVALLGVLKAGGAYVPMDPSYPEDRVSYMIEDTGALLVISHSNSSLVCKKFSGHVIELDTDQALFGAQPLTPFESGRSPENAAYVIYTSGSTGRPKGVIIADFNVVRLFETDVPLYDFNGDDVWTMFHSFCFDFSVWEMYGALFYGGKLIVVPKAATQDTMLFGKLLLDEKVTVLNQTPSAFYVLQDYLTKNTSSVAIRYVIFGGEALNPSKLKPWSSLYSNCRLINMYGITETTVHVTYQELLPVHIESSQSVIGKPIPTLQAYIFNSGQHLSPVGVNGELYIGGAGVARGYLNRESLTAEKFIEHPLLPGKRLYRTGDLARWNTDGTLEYLGRIDDQVKIRGFRIELGEIESVLEQSGLVRQSVVLAKTDHQGNKRLVGYVVAERPLDKQKIQEHLKLHLPEYMVPALWVSIDEIPLTVNGKVNRKALPDPDVSELSSKEYIAPRSETEIKLAGIWQDLLGIEQVGIADNFFELGGDSIRVIRVVSKIADVFGKEVRVFDVYRAKTILELAALIDEHTADHSAQVKNYNEVKEELEQFKNAALLNFPDKDQIEDIYPMSDIERGMVYISSVNPEEALYHDQFVLKMPKSMDVVLLKKALTLLVQKHNILRTAFPQAAEDLQVVYKSIEFDIDYFNIEFVNGKKLKDTIEEYLAEERKNPFDVSKAPLWKASVFGHKKYNILIFQFHHAILDGWSVASLNTELYNLCQRLLTESEQVSLLPLTGSYKDFIIESLIAKREGADETFWKQELSGYKRLDIFLKEDNLQMCEWTCDSAYIERLQEKLKRDKISLKGLFFGAYLHCLGMMTYDDELTVGLITNNRPVREDGDQLLGCFLNSIPFRFHKMDSKETWQLYFQKIEDQLFRIKERDRTSLMEIKKITRESSTDENPFFDAVFNFINFHVYDHIGFDVSKENEYETGDESLTINGYELTNTYLDCTTSITANTLTVSFSLRKELKSGKKLEELQTYFKNVITAYLEDYTSPVANSIILPDYELNRQLKQFSHAGGERVVADQTLANLFEKQAALTPGAIALVYGDERLTYKELNERSNQLGHYLKSKGVKPETLVPICLDRSTELVIAILGILKAGGAYVPVDTNYPADRISFMLSDSGCAMVITSIRFADLCQTDDPGIELLCLDELEMILLACPVSNVPHDSQVGNLAYVIYTSGSTGRPKGTMITHKGVLNMIDCHVSIYNVTAESSMTVMSSIGFDASVWEIWPYLGTGATIHLLEDQIRVAPEELVNYYINHEITHSFIATGLVVDVVNILRKSITSLEYLMTAGDRLGAMDVKDLPFILVNNYGPTENTIVATYYPLTDLDGDTLPPIGKPVSNVTTFIVDGFLNVSPLGVAGELCIGGVQLARGYLNLPELTENKFVSNPLNSGQRLYRSGDLVRWLPDGNMEFLGRIDDQVKIRGYRIELGEIENVLLQYPGISNGIVLAKADHHNNKRLIGYIVPEPSFSKTELQSWLKERLPEYMVPGLWIEMEEIPLTDNGKIDRKALLSISEGDTTTAVFVAPRNKTEDLLAVIWQNLLGVERAGVLDNFFDLGGHSLLAMRLMTAIRNEFAVEISMRDLFTHLTIAALADYIDGKKGKTVLPDLVVQPKGKQIPLSFSQERLWFIDQLEGSTHYHIPAVLRLHGVVDQDALTYALQTIINRHEVLRTVFREENGIAYQKIMGTDQWALSEINKGSDTLKDQQVAEFIDQPFNLSADYMLRAALFPVAENEELLVIVMHHIASDGWSLSVIVNELTELYYAYTHDQLPKLPVLAVQYADYSIWQKTYISGDLLAGQQTYWKKQLAGLEPLQLATDYARPAVQSTRGAVIETLLNKELADQLDELSQQQQVTLFMTLLSAFQVLLYRHTGQDDICVGTPIAGRLRQETENLIGFFINTLAIRSDLSGNLSFNNLLKQVKNTLLDSYDHQDIPFEKVVDAVVSDRDRSRSPLFQVLFALQNTPDASELNLGDIPFVVEEPDYKTSKFDLSFTMQQGEKGLSLSVEYCTDLFAEETISGLITHFEQLLKAIIADPDENIAVLQMLQPAEELLLLEEFSGMAAGYPQDTTITDLIAAQVKRVPDAVAVVYEQQQLTYRELDEKSNQLGRYLRNQGVQAETLVPVCLERSLDMIVAILGVLKAGGAYVPMDPSYPEDRISYMLEDTGALLVISHSNCSVVCEKFSGQVIELDTDHQLIGAEAITGFDSERVPENAAYVIYTSGSTGRPKGVIIEDINVVRLFETDQPLFDFNGNDVWTMFHSFCFDFSVWEMYGALFYGGRLVVVPKAATQDTALFGKLLLEEKVTVLNQTPSAFYVLQDYLTKNASSVAIRYVIFGGEALNPVKLKPWNELYKNCRLINMYGITETTVHVTYQELLPVHLQSSQSLIGKPIPTLRAYIFNQSQHLSPIGVVGELYIGGAGVARGYLNLPVLTAERFVQHSLLPGARLYRTGDLARWNADGTIEYLGRIDDQVKIRGFRIELGEIESILEQSGLVRQNVILAKKDNYGNQYLAGYVVPEGVLNKEEIQDYLRIHLPEYMVPALWVSMDEIPLTVNGKVNRKALPDPDVRALSSKEFVAPRNATEQILVNIWQELLGIPQIGIQDSFFELGGHSLLVTRLTAAIRKELSIELAIKDVFLYPVAAALAAYLDTPGTGKLLPSIILNNRPELIPLSFSQERLWFIDQLEGSSHYHIPAVLRLKGKLNRAALQQAIQSIVNRHEILRTVIREDDGIGYQLVLPANQWQLSAITVKGDSKLTVAGFINEPFNLSSDHLLRAGLLSLAEEECLLVLVMHHIASDGWSLSVIVKELSELYNAYSGAFEPVLDPLAVQYADYAIWQRTHITGELLQLQQDYWTHKLAGAESLQLPTDFPRPAMQSTAGNILYYNLPGDLASSLNQYSKEQGVTLFMTLLSAFQVLLYRYSGQQDVTVGTLVAGRTQQEIENLVGFFINTLAIRSDLGGEPSFDELVQKVKTTLLEAYGHQDMPFEKALEMVAGNRDLGKNPLFQVMFILQNTPDNSELVLHKLTVSQEAPDYSPSQFDINFVVTEQKEGLLLEIGYCTDLFLEDTILRLAGHYEQLLRAVIAASDTQINRLKMMTSAEEVSLLAQFSGPETAYPKQSNVVAIFEEWALKTPDAVAVLFENQAYTYKELNEKANRLAHYLIDKGMKADQLTGLCIGRSLDMITGILGIWKAGGAYVPIDPSYPAERVDYLLNDSGIDLIISDQQSRGALPAHLQKTLILLGGSGFLTGQRVTSPVNRIAGQDLSYMIYTSGSTGKPKGVLVEHQGMLNHLYAKVNELQLDQNSVIAYTASYTFDISVWQMFCALLTGGCTVVYPAALILEPAALISKVEADQVTVLELVPSYLAAVLQEKTSVRLKNLRYLLVTGEAVSQSVLAQWFAHPDYGRIPVVNAYGPTEASDDITHHFMHSTPQTSNVPLGKTIQNLHIYILDAYGQICPLGVPGEICVSGIGVSRGYLNRAELTSEKFIADPFRSGNKLYKTGDLGRTLPEGTIEYLGRIDDQVKIRGYRIELGEIEYVLNQHPAIEQSIVIAKSDQQGTKRLIAYFVSSKDTDALSQQEGFSNEALTGYLKKHLPEYMIPVLIRLDQLPLTANGKIDKKALPEPEGELLSAKIYTGPRNHTEQALADIWQELLQVRKIGIHDNFFELGGHSLIAVRLLSRIRNLGYSMQLSDLMTFPTIAGQSAVLNGTADDEEAEIEEFNKKHIILLNKAKAGTPLFILPGGVGLVDGYDKIAKEIETVAPVYGLNMVGSLQGETPLQHMKDIAEQNVKWIRKIQNKGPYRLAGHSLGGWIVFEMTKILEAMNEKVELAAIIDVSPRDIMPSGAEVLIQDAVAYLEVFELIKADQPHPDWLLKFKSEIHQLPAHEMREFMLDFIVTQYRDLKKGTEFDLKLVYLLVFNSTNYNYVTSGKVNAALTIIRADIQKWENDGFKEDLGWLAHSDLIKASVTPGDHFNMTFGENGTTMGGYLKGLLEALK